MDKSKWSYLAGLLDGEGHFSLARTKQHRQNEGHAFNLLIGITNRSHELMKWLIRNFGGVYYLRKSENPKWADRYDWYIKGRKNKEEIILGVLPHLIIKREQANIALESIRLAYSQNPEKRQELAERMRQLNRRGQSPETNTSGDTVSVSKIESELTGDCESDPAVMSEVVQT